MLGHALAEVGNREGGDQVDVVTAADEAVCDSAGVCQRAACLDAEPEVGVDRDDAAARSEPRLEPRRRAELIEPPGGSPTGELSVHAGSRDSECRAADLCAGDALAADDRRGRPRSTRAAQSRRRPPTAAGSTPSRCPRARSDRVGRASGGASRASLGCRVAAAAGCSDTRARRLRSPRGALGTRGRAGRP